jgi:hypothetical protein
MHVTLVPSVLYQNIVLFFLWFAHNTGDETTTMASTTTSSWWGWV